MKKIVLSPTTSSLVLQAYMGTETLDGQCHMLWVITGLGCGRSRVHILGEPPFLKVSVSNEIGYKHEVGLGLIMRFQICFENLVAICSQQVPCVPSPIMPISQPQTGKSWIYGISKECGLSFVFNLCHLIILISPVTQSCHV